mmetsp:Transcript_6378/g.14957  ORF Transcript_6378/g.14957 Transcript_6378/m.14957 type:complete len:210 (+) Transcript_6378:159-788(+)
MTNINTIAPSKTGTPRAGSWGAQVAPNTTPHSSMQHTNRSGKNSGATPNLRMRLTNPSQKCSYVVGISSRFFSWMRCGEQEDRISRPSSCRGMQPKSDAMNMRMIDHVRILFDRSSHSSSTLFNKSSTLSSPLPARKMLKPSSKEEIHGVRLLSLPCFARSETCSTLPTLYVARTSPMSSLARDVSKSKRNKSRSSWTRVPAWQLLASD